MKSCFAALLAGCLLLTGCTSLPSATLPARDDLRDFSLEGRFALRVTQAGRPAESSGGRLSWEHKQGANRILIANPLGVGLAEIETSPALSRLHTADGRTLESPNAEDLMEDVTGQRLPVTRLPGWLLGRPGQGSQFSRDAAGRPAHLHEAGWQIEYAYDDEAPGTLPSRVTLNHNGEIELRLRIEEWKEIP